MSQNAHRCHRKLNPLAFSFFTLVLASPCIAQSAEAEAPAENTLSSVNTSSKNTIESQNNTTPEFNDYFYLGGKVGVNHYQDACESWKVDCEDSDLAGGAFFGYQFSENFAVEAAYLTLGEAVATYLETGLLQDYVGTMQGLELSALGSINLTDDFAAFAKAGTFNWYGKNKGPTATIKEDGWVPTAGVGLSYQLSDNWQARLEYQYFHELGDSNIGGSNSHLTTLGISYQFGRTKAAVRQQPQATSPVKPVAPKPVPVIVPVKAEVLPRTASTILFDFDSSQLTDTTGLSAVIERLTAHGSATVLLSGFTDSTGSEDYNLALSKKRIEAISEYLLAKGVQPHQVNKKAFGERSPLFDNNSKANRLKNRRVFVLMPEYTVPVVESEQGAL